MSDTLEPIAAVEANGPLPANPQNSAHWPEPFGIVRTFGWAILASIAAVLTGAAFILAIGETSWEPRSELDAVPFASVAAMIADVAFFAVIVWGCRRNGWRAIDYLGLVRPQGRYLRASLIAFCVALAFPTIASNFGTLIDDQSSLVRLLPPVHFFVAVAIVAPIAEELMFRGFLYRGLAASRLGISGAILVTSLLWAGLHTDRTWLGFADILFSGIVLGWLRWRSGSTLTPIAVHGVNNIIAVVAELLGW